MIVPDTLTYSISDALPLLEADRNALLNASRYLLHSHNSAVVMASSQLLFYLNAKDDYPAVVRALIHTLHRNREVQYIVLSNIASLTIEHRNLFEPYLRSFFIYSTDSLQVKLLKLEILSSLITETSSSVILREFQHYVNSFDEEFVTATIQAIGRCASTVPQISDVCLGGLLRLMSRPKEKIMGECVIVLRKLLQMKEFLKSIGLVTTDHKEIITHIAQLADTMTIPTALASILWLLAAKLCIVNPRQTLLLTQYIFNLAKYDVNYDIRDKARFLRGLLFPQIITNPTVIGDDSSLRIPKNELKSNNSNNTFLSKNIRKICLATKPAPIVKSQFEAYDEDNEGTNMCQKLTEFKGAFQLRSNFRLGTLSHILQRRVSGYCDLTDWPTVPPDPWSRVIVTPLPSLSSAINGSESSDVMNSPKAVSSSHVKHGQNETRKTDRFGNISLNDFFSETEEEDDDDEVDDGSIGNEGQEENGKHKRKLSPFYANDNGSSDDECISSNDEQIEDSKEAFDKDNDESDSDFDLEYLLLGSTMLNHIQEKSTTSSNLSSESQPTGAVPDSSFTTSQDTTTTSGILKHDFLSEKFSNNELQISMKQDLSSWLNTQSSSSSSDESDHSVLHDTSIEQLVKTSDYNPSKDDRAGNYSLPWYTLINPHHESDFTGQLQYARIIWPNHPKLILKPQSTSTVNFGIDFAGLCDPIELDLIYESKADSFNSENESSYRWRICLNPPPTELIRPVQLNEKEYFDERAKLILNQSFYHNHLMITSNDNENRCHSEYLCKLKTHLLQNINAQYQFSRIHKISKHLYCNDIELHKNFSSTPSMNVNTSNEYNDDDDNNNNVCITMYITSESISNSHLCLLEISYFPDRLIDRNVHLPIHFSLFCNSSSIFRKNLSLSIENLIKSL
ncbi:AP-3 complex subunit beta-1 [Schistosoma japonicum]|nr:AP-3 complex subunit beta-1 [Schistosoma japonicum]